MRNTLIRYFSVISVIKINNVTHPPLEASRFSEKIIKIFKFNWVILTRTRINTIIKGADAHQCKGDEINSVLQSEKSGDKKKW